MWAALAVVAVLVLAVVLVVWFVLPELIFHRARQGVIWRATGRGSKGLVALTFDDGPDPRYTPRILTILGRHGACATFFVVGARAALHPGLLREILAGGNEVGNHTLNHCHAWTLGPLATLRQLRRTDELVEGLSGARPRLFRPPWGFFNLATYLLGGRNHRLVLWSIAPLDWKPETGPAHVAELVLSRVRGGDIIDLHDSGPRGTPEQVIKALEPIISGLKRKGLRPVTVSELLAASDGRK